MQKHNETPQCLLLTPKANKMENGVDDDIKKNRDYWFLVANEYVDFLDWIMDNYLPEYDLKDLDEEWKKTFTDNSSQ